MHKIVPDFADQSLAMEKELGYSKRWGGPGLDVWLQTGFIVEPIGIMGLTCGIVLKIKTQPEAEMIFAVLGMNLPDAIKERVIGQIANNSKEVMRKYPIEFGVARLQKTIKPPIAPQ